MREFILLSLKGKTTPDFSLDSLPKAGRLDLVCRFISNALWISNDLRRDTIVYVALSGPNSPPKVITFNGRELKGLEPDERSIGKAIQSALQSGLNLELGQSLEVSPGITVTKKAVETLIKEKSDKQIVYLHPQGTDLREFNFQKNVVFILGDMIGLPRKTEKLLERLGAKKVNLGPVMLFASHCSIVVHNELDRKVF